MELVRGSGSGEQAHDQPEIVTCDVDQIALVDVGAAAQPGASHATTIKDQSEAALHPFGAQPEGLARHAGQQACAIVIDRPPRGMIAVPAQNSVDPSLRHARLPWSVRQALQRVAGVIAFVGDQLRRCLWRGCRINGLLNSFLAPKLQVWA